MPLDVAVAPKTLTSTLHYLKRGTEKPAYYRIEPPPGVPRSNGINDPHEVTIEDARGRESEFTLDRNGFALIKAPTAMTGFHSPDEIKRVYYPEVERLVRYAGRQPRLPLRSQPEKPHAAGHARALAPGA